MIKKFLCVLLLIILALCGCNQVKTSSEESAESYPTVSEIKAMMPQNPDENYVERYYGGKLNIVSRYVTEDEIDPNNDVYEGDKRYGVTDADGNLVLNKIYVVIMILSENRIYALQKGAEKGGKRVNYLASIFDEKGRVISDQEYWSIHYNLSPVTGNYFPIGCGQKYNPDDEKAEIMYYLVDFDGRIVLDSRIIRILRYGDDPIANDPNVLIALDYYNDQRYVIDSEGNITCDGVSIVHGPNYVESYYGGKLNIVRRFVTEDEIDPDNDILEGDMRVGVTDADGNLILSKIYGNIMILSENRIYAVQSNAEKNGRRVNSLASIFDAKGRVISDKEYWSIHYNLSPVTGSYFPIGCGQAYNPDDEDAEITYYLVDFDGNRVLDRRIIRILRYGDDPTANDPNVLIAIDYYNNERYIIDIQGNITRKSDGVTIVHGSKAG